MSYKISHSYNWYKIETNMIIIKTYYINGIAFTFDELVKICQDNPNIINEANKNKIYTPEYFYQNSFYLIEEEMHPLVFNVELENPEDLPQDDYYEEDSYS